MKTTLLLTAALCLLAPAVISADKGAVEVDQARTTLKKWVETRRIISQEKRDWALAREVLNGRIDLVQREIDAQRDKIGETEASIAAVHHQRAELIEENEQLKAAAEALSNTLVGLEARTTELLQRLPDALRAHVRPLSQRLPKSLPDHPKDTKLSLAERFQNVIGILNEVNKFNREITVSSEVLTLSDGASAEVTALYVGIGKAYYVSRNGSAAGIGTASPDGWVWQPANAAAEQIANAIAILKNERVASFVTLPIEIE